MQEYVRACKELRECVRTFEGVQGHMRVHEGMQVGVRGCKDMQEEVRT